MVRREVRRRTLAHTRRYLADSGMKRAARSKLITCILPKGKAMTVLKRLRQEQGIVSANINHARGSGRLTPLAYRGVGEQTEKEILSVVVDETRADAVFALIFHAGEIDRPHGGLLFQSALTGYTGYRLPDGLPDEK